MRLGLASLIAPVSPEEFLEQFWEKEVLHIPGDGTKRRWIADSPLWLEETIHYFCTTWGEVSVARAGTKPSECRHTILPPTIATIAQAFDENYTIVVNDMQKKDNNVAKLCRSIERDLFCRANVNLYITNRNGHGLRYHYDDDDVIILQLRGQKSWRIYDEREILPLGNTPYREVDCDSMHYRSFELRAGDVFYVPRGVIHEAFCGDTISMHLTISLNVVRWAQLLKELVQVSAESDVDLRRAIPVAALRSGKFAERASAPACLARLLSCEELLESALARVQDNVLSGAQRLPQLPLGAAPETDGIDGDTIVMVSDDQIYCLNNVDDQWVLKGVGTHVQFPEALKSVANFLANTGPFSAAELPCALPVEEKVAIVRRLAADGFLVRACRTQDLGGG